MPNTDELWFYIAGASLLGGYIEGPYYPSNLIPPRLKYAVIELARTLIVADRTAERLGYVERVYEKH